MGLPPNDCCILPWFSHFPMVFLKATKSNLDSRTTSHYIIVTILYTNYTIVTIVVTRTHTHTHTYAQCTHNSQHTMCSLTHMRRVTLFPPESMHQQCRLALQYPLVSCTQPKKQRIAKVSILGDTNTN